jgi:hypothetical protein
MNCWFNRFEKTKFVGAEEGATIYHNSYIYEDVSIGKYTWMAPFTLGCIWWKTSHRQLLQRQ